MDTLFTLEQMMAMSVRSRQALLGIAKTPLIIFIVILVSIATLGVGYAEYEILFRIFEDLTGEDGYWSPHVMGFTGIIVILAVHLLAKTDPQGLTARFINGSVKILVPIYLIGAGLYIASMLDLASLIETQNIPIPGETLNAAEQFQESLISIMTTKAAVIAFTLGLGGLAVINVFVASKLISIINSNIENLFGRITIAKEAVKDFNIIKRCQKEYLAQKNELNEFVINCDERYIRLQITSHIQSIIAEELEPHKANLNQQEIQGEPLFGGAPAADLKYIKKAIAKIESISTGEILKPMNPAILEKKL